MAATDAAESAVAFERMSKDADSALAKSLKPPGHFAQLPPLLEERRLQYKIPNGMFTRQACFDWIYLWQVPEHEGGTGKIGEGLLYAPDTGASRMKEEAPCGIICSAGLQALDHLRSNGMDLGHKIQFVKMAPCRILADIIEGKWLYGIVIRDGDVMSSFDLAEEQRQQRVRASRKQWNDGVERHYYHNGNGEPYQPTVPWMPDDV